MFISLFQYCLSSLSFTGSFTEDEQHLFAPLFPFRSHKNTGNIDCSPATACPRKAFLLKKALNYLYTLSVTPRSVLVCCEELHPVKEKSVCHTLSCSFDDRPDRMCPLG